MEVYTPADVTKPEYELLGVVDFTPWPFDNNSTIRTTISNYVDEFVGVEEGRSVLYMDSDYDRLIVKFRKHNGETIEAITSWEALIANRFVGEQPS